VALGGDKMKFKLMPYEQWYQVFGKIKEQIEQLVKELLSEVSGGAVVLVAYDNDKDRIVIYLNGEEVAVIEDKEKKEVIE